MKRKKGVMGMALYQKIINDAATVPFIDHLTLNGLGEPTLDALLVDRIRYARKFMPAITIDFYTNGSKLSRELCDKLKKAGITCIFISLNAVREKTREEIMGLNDYSHVEEMCNYLKEIGVKIYVLSTINKDLMEQSDIDKMKEDWGKDAMPHLEGNWAGKLYMPRVKQHNCCSRALTQIMVLWDGRVSLCCQDGEGEVIFGNLNDQTIREVYNSPEYLRYREFHHDGKRSELKLCDVCTTN
jgi:radical SAM protein with 4Fe4S-binding SPASM domain